MRLMDKLERKFGRYAIPHLTQFIILTYVLGYVISILAPNIQRYLTLDPYFILHGQVWRIVTWLLIPPSRLDIFTIIMLLFYYSLGTNLECAWGAFRYNVYILGGILITLIGAFVFYGVEVAILGTAAITFGSLFSTYYISLSIFLGFAATYPNMQVLLYFIIPVKIKWLAYLDVAYLAVMMIIGGWATRVVIICSLMNFIIFFLSTRNMRRYNPKEIHRKKVYTQAVHKGQMNVTKHKCAVCGRTEKDGDHLEFRFCSKCNGNYEYCQDHLFTHEHIK